MNKKIEKAFNTHLNAEFYSAYLYLSMANYFAAQNLEGMTTWMRIQVDEERMHGLKFVDFINDRGGRVILEQIDKPKTDWSSPLDAFQDALDHERLISKKINELVDLADQGERPRRQCVPAVVRHRAGGGRGERAGDCRKTRVDQGQFDGPADDRSAAWATDAERRAAGGGRCTVQCLVRPADRSSGSASAAVIIPGSHVTAQSRRTVPLAGRTALFQLRRISRQRAIDRARCSSASPVMP